jgi:hypothetical protein
VNSAALQALVPAGIQAIAYLKPKIVVKAPNGQNLWIDPLASISTAPGTGGPSLWPSGLSMTMATGDAPPESATDTSSVPLFAGKQAWVLANAPGPLGVPYSAWLVGGAFALAIGLVWLRKRKSYEGR